MCHAYVYTIKLQRGKYLSIYTQTEAYVYGRKNVEREREGEGEKMKTVNEIINE